MKIPARVAQVVRPAAGGIRRHVIDLVSNLDKQRFSSAVFAPARFLLDTEGQSLRHIPFEIGSRTRLIGDIRAIARLTRMVRGNFDIVHAHGLRGAFIGVLAASRAQIPAVVTAHNLLSVSGLLPRLLLKVINSKSARIIAVSEAVAATLIAEGVAPDSISVIPNGIDAKAFALPVDPLRVRAYYGMEAVDPLFVSVGRLSPEKGFDILLSAFGEVSAEIPNAGLILAGSGPEEARLHTRAVCLPHARFVGFVPDVAPLLAAADIVVIPSRREGQGIIALEAMASERPIIASEVGGLAETVSSNLTGILVPPENPNALAKAMIDLANNASLRQAMGKAGRLQLLERFQLAPLVKRIESVYDRALHLE